MQSSRHGLADVTAVTLTLHLDRDRVSIGESIRPQLEIRNRGARDVVFGTGFAFDWERLVFAGPNAVHLIDPEGLDLALPYRREQSYFSELKPISVAANREEWLYLPISAHLQLRQPGRYTFWVELCDSANNRYKSNEVSFTLSDVAGRTPADSVELSLRPAHTKYAGDEPVQIEVILKNHSDKEVILLKPQEDSFDGWVNPAYRFTVTDAAGRSLALPLRCGTMAEPVYADNSRWLMGPGNEQRLLLTLPKFIGMNQPGVYRLRLTYIVRDTAIGKGGDVLATPMHWDPRTFVGRVESNEITIAVD